MRKTGADIFVESLRHEGVKTVFGLPGGVVLKIFDVLCQQKDIELVLTFGVHGPKELIVLIVD